LPWIYDPYWLAVQQRSRMVIPYHRLSIVKAWIVPVSWGAIALLAAMPDSTALSVLRPRAVPV
jgi:hypothetical protein